MKKQYKSNVHYVYYGDHKPMVEHKGKSSKQCAICKKEKK